MSERERVAADEAAIQDQIGGNHCWGCGTLNPDGLQIKSHWLGDGRATCTFMPRPAHMAGPTHVVNGGILATVIDCHSVCTAIAHAYAAEGRAIGSAPDLWCATGSLNITYLRPTPINQPMLLAAQILADDGKRITVACTVASGGKECARAEAVAVRVPSTWRKD